MVVLSTGNLPPRAPLPADAWLQDHPAFVPDPWSISALADLDPDAPVLLLGTGLTGVIAPLIGGTVLDAYGWRAMVIALPMLWLLVAFPLCYLQDNAAAHQNIHYAK
jgi:hypothetical protein